MKKLTTLLFCIVAVCANAQYFQHLFPTSTTLTSAERTTINSNGYVMAGFNSASPVADFLIHHVDNTGAYNNTTDFAAAYEIWDDVGCNTPARVYNCQGVKVIETQNLGNNEAYALVGVYELGVFFATLDATGNVIKTYRWIFPTVFAPPLPGNFTQTDPCISLQTDPSLSHAFFVES
jgi:hypothetical protein